MTTIAWTGHRPDKLPSEKLPLINGALLGAIDLFSPKRAISGMAPGIDVRGLLAAWIKGVPVTASIPWIGHPFSGNWDFGRQLDEYMRLLNLCDTHHICCEGEHYRPWFYQKRNEWMVDHCDILCAVWDGTPGGTANCIKYANKVGRKIVYMDWENGSWNERD